jgi:hypothetical protein
MDPSAILNMGESRKITTFKIIQCASEAEIVILYVMRQMQVRVYLNCNLMAC